MARRGIHNRNGHSGMHQQQSITTQRSIRRLRWGTIAYFTLGIAVVVVTLLQIFAPLMQQGLQAQQSVYVSQPKQQLDSGAGLQSSPPTVGPTQLSVSLHAFAQDTFQRADQQMWAVASDQQVWQGDDAVHFAIRNDAGEIGGGQGKMTALLGSVTLNADVQFSASMSAFQQGTSNMGVVLRYTNTKTWDKTYLDGSKLIIMQHVGEESLSLASIPFVAQDGVSYSIRFRAEGTHLQAKAWQRDAPEPGNWMLSANDLWLQSGQNGIRVVLQPTTSIRVTQFLVQPVQTQG